MPGLGPWHAEECTGSVSGRVLDETNRALRRASREASGRRRNLAGMVLVWPLSGAAVLFAGGPKYVPGVIYFDQSVVGQPILSPFIGRAAAGGTSWTRGH